MHLKIIETEDGSHTIFNSDLNESYHSIHGAIQESEHVFINTGLSTFIGDNTKINILEVGFGTGLNALLSMQYCDCNNMNINYIAIEPFPIENFKSLNYCNNAKLKNYYKYFDMLHTCEPNKMVEVNTYFCFKKIDKTIETVDLNGFKFDLVYFDTFSPNVALAQWSVYVFTKIRKVLKLGAILVTYSSKGEIRRNLCQSGFKVEKVKGAKGKREMVKAYAI